MIPKAPEPTRNIPARLVGWEQEGGARVELLADTGTLTLGSVAKASLRPTALGRPGVDFDFLRKKGLRTGGIVLLRRVSDEGDGSLSAKSVETVVNRESDGLAYVLHDAAACILPPAAGTSMVAECMIAMAGDAVATRSPAEGIARMTTALDQACQFGIGGLAFTGEGRDGSVLEVVVGGDTARSSGELAEEFIARCPRDVLQEARKSKGSWYLVPFFRAEFDPDRSSRMSAQYANLDYGTPDEPLWTGTNAVLRAFADSWLVGDASVVAEVPGQSAMILLDLLDKA